MEEPMNNPKIPKTDSIMELAAFWDTHDATDFEDELEEVAAPVFRRRTALSVPLKSSEIKAVERLALARGIPCDQLLREWVLEKLGDI